MLRKQTDFDALSFLAGRGEMAKRIREFDWSSHPFGPTDTWPQSLRSALSICLHSAFPTAIYWGSELRLLYNDAWAPIPGPRHPGALGAPAQEVWSDIWHILEPQFSHLIATGEGLYVQDQMLPLRRFGLPEETYWNYSFTAIRGEDGAIAGVFNSGSETTDKVLARSEMRFLLEVDDLFRDPADLRAAQRSAIRMLGQHLGGDRVGIRVLDPDHRGIGTMFDEWAAPGIDKAAGFEISDLGAWAMDLLSRGRTVRIDDIRDNDNAAEMRETLAALDVRSLIAVPSSEYGRIVAVIFVQSRTPRRWSDFDVSTTEKLLDRTLSWMERERAAEKERMMVRETDHRARNVLAVVQSVVRLTLAEDLTTFREKIGDRIAAIARSHSLVSTRRWEPVELRALLDEELAPYLDSEGQRIDLDGLPVLLRPEQAQMIALLFYELATNAAKYGSLSVPGGHLSISWKRQRGDILTITWSETGNVAAPGESNRSGFGSTLLETVVERQLGGSFERGFADGALQCVMHLPLEAIEPRLAVGVTQAAADDATNLARILIVEDDVIVALGLEDTVKGLGYEIFATAHSVNDGLSALDQGSPDLAIVDMNLSGKSSRPVAEALAKRGVPIVLATGYLDQGDYPDHLADLPRLSKPIDESDLKRTIAEALG